MNVAQHTFLVCFAKTCIKRYAMNIWVFKAITQNCFIYTGYLKRKFSVGEIIISDKFTKNFQIKEV